MPNLLKARGLRTFQNENTVPDGSMDVADNIVIDEDDVVELRRGQADFGDALPLESDRVKQVAEYKDLLIRHFNNTLQFDDGSGSFSDFSGSYQELEDGLRIKYLEANGNFYFTDNTGIKKISAKTASQVTVNSISDAGVPRAVSLNASLQFAVGGFLPPQSKCAYRILWGKKDNNGNLLLGYPSERFVLTNTSDTISVQESFSLNVLEVPTNDDVVTFATEEVQYFLWFDTNSETPESAPETSQTLGRTPVRVQLYDPVETTLTSASKIANAIANLGGFNVSVASNEVTVELSTPGNVEDPEAYLSGTPSALNFDINVLEQGSIADGDSANAIVRFTVPEGIDSTYFYQIYRTSPVTVPEGLSLDDIDPGDEMNLAFEGSPIDTDGSLLTEIEFTDIIPEDFRASAVFLYTNPISGEGILQANSKPPVAKDVTLFNGSTFFANTKTTHKFTVNLVSVLKMTSGVSDFIIGNEDVVRKYTAVGVTQVQDISIESSNLEGKAFFINSARDEREYFVWYDLNGTTQIPSLEEFDNKQALRVRISSKLSDELDSTTSIDDTTEEITLPNHGLIEGQEVIVRLESGNLPAGLNNNEVYTVVVIDENTIQLNDGALVDLTADVGSFKLDALESTSSIATKTATALAATNDFLISIPSFFTEEINSTTSIDEATNQITLTNHRLVENQEVIVKLETDELPLGLENGEIYSVVVIDSNTIQLSKDNNIVDLTNKVGTFKLERFDGSTLKITMAKNGVTTEALESTLISNNEITFATPSTLGDGEDTANQEFLLSNIISVGASIDESARSLVKVINADLLSPVNAYYLSGADDVPGIILLEARNLEDKTFYISTSDPNILNDFDPSLTQEKGITGYTIDGSNLVIESVSHGISVGQEVFIHNTNTTPAIQGTFEVIATTPNTFTIQAEVTAVPEPPTEEEGEFFLATNSSDNEETPNRLYFSKPFQPESVPIVNFIDIGPKDKAISRILPLRDNLFALKEDGIYIVSGSSAPNFSVRLLDSSVSILAPDSAVVLNNAIYALSDDGVVRISDTGVEVISRPIEDLIKKVVNSRFNYEFTSFGIAYSSDRSYLLWLPERVTDTVATQCYRYNTFTRSWTRFTISATCGLVANRDDKMYLGAGDRNFLTQERKNGDRTDYADRDFTLSLLPNGVDSNSIQVSSVLEVSEGDVVYQEQYVTLSVIKRLLRKLDVDKLVPSSDYFSSIPVEFGDKISTLVQAIISKLLADSIVVTNQTISDDPVTQQTQFNQLIDELNDPLSGTASKNYKKALDMIPYEAVVESITTINNTLTLLIETPFVEGDVTIYKGIAAKWQYAPEHFGDPSSLKQIRQGTIIFDQNAFYGGIIAYASDQSADFVDTPYSGYGTGVWGGDEWGEGTWGGLGNDIPYRTLVPLEKQRCRYLTVQIRHNNAREILRVNGISLMVRQLSNRAYR